MRNLVAIVTTCVILSSSIAMAVEAEKMDDSTNPNSNVNVKTQNLQQKPNSDQPQSTDEKSKHHKKTSHEHKSTVDPASDEVNRDGISNTEKLRQKPN